MGRLSASVSLLGGAEHSQTFGICHILDELPCIHLQSRSKVTYFDNFAYQGSWACVVSANSFMDLFQNVFSLLLVDALQVRHGEVSFVQGVVQDREPDCSFPDFPSLLDVLWKPSVLKEGQDWGHPIASALDYEGRDFFNDGAFLDLHLYVHTCRYCF